MLLLRPRAKHTPPWLPYPFGAPLKLQTRYCKSKCNSRLIHGNEASGDWSYYHLDISCQGAQSPKRLETIDSGRPPASLDARAHGEEDARFSRGKDGELVTVFRAIKEPLDCTTEATRKYSDTKTDFRAKSLANNGELNDRQRDEEKFSPP